MTEDRWALIKMLIEQNTSSIADVVQHVRKLEEDKQLSEKVAIRLEGRLISLEKWQKKLVQTLEAANENKRSWIKEVGLILISVITTLLATSVNLKELVR